MSYTDKLTALSNSIKAKNPSYTGTLTLAKMKEAVDSISSGVDTSVITATAADCLATKKILLADGTLASGTIPTKSGVTTTLSKSTTSYTIPAGYYTSTGKVSITAQTKTVTPTSSSQSITADSGKVLTGVTVNGHGKLVLYSGTVTGNGSYSLTIPIGSSSFSTNPCYLIIVPSSSANNKVFSLDQITYLTNMRRNNITNLLEPTIYTTYMYYLDDGINTGDVSAFQEVDGMKIKKSGSNLVVSGFAYAYQYNGEDTVQCTFMSSTVYNYYFVG